MEGMGVRVQGREKVCFLTVESNGFFFFFN